MRPNMRKKYESYISLVKEFQDDVGGPFPLQNATLDFEDLDKYFTVINLTDTIEKVQWCRVFPRTFCSKGFFEQFVRRHCDSESLDT